MPPAKHLKLGILFAIGKGAVIAGILAHYALTFGQQIIVAGVSASLTTVGVIAAAVIGARAAAQNRERIEEVHEDVQHLKRAGGVSRRETDHDS